MTIKIGIIGTGFGQRVHVPAFRTDSRCSIVAISSRDQEKAKKTANDLNIPKSFGDWKSLITSAGVNAVTISVPPLDQPDIARFAMENGLHTFLEKPFGLVEQSPEPLLQLAKEKKLAHVINFEFPECDTWQKAKSLLDANEIGKLQQVNIVWSISMNAPAANMATWKDDIPQGGGLLYQFGSHIFHYLTWFLGNISLKDINHTEHQCQLNLTSEANVSIHVEMEKSFTGNENKHHILFKGEKGELALTNNSRDYIKGFELSYKGASLKEDPSKKEDGRIAATGRLVKNFCDWIETGQAKQPNLFDTISVNNLIKDAFKKSNISIL